MPDQPAFQFKLASQSARRRAFSLLWGTGLALSLSLAPALAEEADKLLNAPIAPVPPLLTEKAIDTATAALDGIVESAMKRTGLPGIAVGVVYKDKVIYAKGFGVRELGKPGKIDPDTVFMLASVSKPIASTIVAKLVADGIVKWDDTAKGHNPAFALSDPYVTENATIADLMSHRSGLHTGSGDLLEDLGFDRTYILSHLDQQPLDPFRSTYHYSNFGYTPAASPPRSRPARRGKISPRRRCSSPPAWQARATVTRTISPTRIGRAFTRACPMGAGRRNTTATRMRKRRPAAPVARSTTCCASRGFSSAAARSTASEIVKADALAPPHEPQMIPGPPREPAARAGFYGFGWNVSYDDEGRVRIGHSGAFNLGAATNITFMPGEDLGIVALTNGRPIGVAEAVGAAFLDVAQNGKQTVDWVGFLGHVFEQMDAADAPEVDYTDVPDSPKPAQDLAAYAGEYGNSYYGPLTVSAEGGKLSMAMGPQGAPTNFALTHFDGDTFSFETIGENANGLAGAIFSLGDDGRATKVVLDYYDKTGLGTFVRE